MSKPKKKETVEINCRCKDCEYSHKNNDKLYCQFWSGSMEPEEVKPDWFCSQGSVFR